MILKTAPQPVKLFSDHSHYGREHRGQLADILRPYWKDAPFSEEQRAQMYGLSAGDFCLVDDLTQADIAVLPMTWNHYLKRRELPRALDFIQAARRIGRPILSYVSGDEGVTVPPECDDVYVVRASGFRSRMQPRQIAQPVFFDDPLKKYPEFADSPFSTLHSPLPKIGFCGQASLSLFKLGLDVVRGCWRNGLCCLNLRSQEPQPVFPPALLRARAMKRLAESPKVRTCFIARERYRGGATDADTRERTTREFYQNMAETDYTLCVRGGGNFSKRFYETLALGRIPVLVDTDCLLPFASVLNWDNYIVRVTQAELATLPEVVARHFSAQGLDGLAELKRRCRMLWEEWLSFGGFHRQLARLILDSAGPMKGGKLGETIPAVKPGSTAAGRVTIPPRRFD